MYGAVSYCDNFVPDEMQPGHSGRVFFTEVTKHRLSDH